MRKQKVAPQVIGGFVQTSEQLLSQAIDNQPGETVQIMYYPTYPLRKPHSWLISPDVIDKSIVAEKGVVDCVQPGQSTCPLNSESIRLVLFLTDGEGLGNTLRLAAFLQRHFGVSESDLQAMTWRDIISRLQQFVSDEGIRMEVIEKPNATYSQWKSKGDTKPERQKRQEDLDDVDLAILMEIGDSETALMINQLEQRLKTDMKTTRSEKTIRVRVQDLVKKGLVYRPKLGRSGVSLTAKGKCLTKAGKEPSA